MAGALLKLVSSLLTGVFSENERTHVRVWCSGFAKMTGLRGRRLGREGWGR
jgi:hypothetical protein